METLCLRAGLPDAFPLPGYGRFVSELVWPSLPDPLVHGQHRTLVRQAQVALEFVQQDVSVPQHPGRQPALDSLRRKAEHGSRPDLIETEPLDQTLSYFVGRGSGWRTRLRAGQREDRPRRLFDSQPALGVTLLCDIGV
jgi:hypothetical protein